MNKVLKAGLLVALIGALGSTALAANIVVLPIDRAKMLAGARFDFRVEVGPAEPSEAEEVEEQGEVETAEAGDVQADDQAGPGAQTGGAGATSLDPAQIEILVNGQPAAEFFGSELEQSRTGEAINFMVRNVTIDEPGDYTVEVTAGEGNSASVTYEVTAPNAEGPRAKNVILFIADGLSYNQMTAARTIAEGMQEGKFNGLLNMEEADAYATVTTSGMDSIITDSANSASAYATGHKSAVNAMGVYPDNTEDDPLDDPRQELITEMIKRARGMSVGVISNSYGTDATPGAFYAHTRRRGEINYIAEQFLEGEANPDVLMIGGSAQFLPQSTPGSGREDERDLITEAEEAGYEFVTNATELEAVEAPSDRLFGLFHDSNLNNYLDRVVWQNPEMLGDYTDQPLLWNVVMKALDVLSRNENGFFLMVEAGNVDKLLHPLDWHRATWDLLEMDLAVGMAKEWAAENGGETLILSTGDHAHSISTYGAYDATQGPGQRNAVGLYADAGFPTYGDEVDEHGLPLPDTDRILAVGIANHPDYCELYVATDVFMAPAIAETQTVEGEEVEIYVANPERCEMGGTLMQGNLPTDASTGVHSLDDIPIYAYGPGSDYFFGIMDNTEVFHGMVSALQLDLVNESAGGDTAAR